MTSTHTLAAVLLACVVSGCGQATGNVPASATASANPYPPDAESPLLWSSAEWNQHAKAPAKQSGQPGK